LGTAATHVRAADHAKRSLLGIAQGLASRSGAAWITLTERRVRPGQGVSCFFPLLSALILAYSPAAFAGCQPTSGDVTCTGNLSNGVIGNALSTSSKNDFNPNSTYSLTVKNLTTDIVPPTGTVPVYGIRWNLSALSSQTGVTELFSSPDHSVDALSQGDFAAGVDLDSHGGPNGSGRFLTLDVNGSLSATGTGGAAVYGFVSGNGGTSGDGDGGSGGTGFLAADWT
jgi:hypothetical protein